jgi:hypothetical protein
MAFDISSAKEIDSSKFDISSATPANKFDLSSAKTIEDTKSGFSEEEAGVSREDIEKADFSRRYNAIPEMATAVAGVVKPAASPAVNQMRKIFNPKQMVTKAEEVAPVAEEAIKSGMEGVKEAPSAWSKMAKAPAEKALEIGQKTDPSVRAASEQIKKSFPGINEGVLALYGISDVSAQAAQDLPQSGSEALKAIPKAMPSSKNAMDSISALEKQSYIERFGLKEDPLKYPKSYGGGLAGGVKAAGSFLEYAGAEEAGKKLQEVSQKVMNDLAVENPSVVDRILNGAGSSTLFIAPGLAVGGVARALSLAPAMAEILGITTATVMESALETGDVYEQALRDGKSKEEATTAADNTMLSNMALLLPSSKFEGLFGKGLGLKGVIRSAMVNAPQEASQQFIQNASLGKPLDEGVAEEGMYGFAVGLLGGGAVHGGHSIMDKMRGNKSPVSREKIIDDAVKEYMEKVVTPTEGNVSTEPTSKEQLIEKLLTVLDESTDIRKKQETLYSQERGKRRVDFEETGKTTFGEKGFYAQLSKLGGELTKVEFESLKGKMGQQEIDSLFEMIKYSPMTTFEKVSAGTGLAKLFGEYGGQVPQNNELSNLRKVFGDKLVGKLLEKRTLFQKGIEMGLEVANVPRALMASFDLSAPLRQGLFFISKPKQFGAAFKAMFPAFLNDKNYNAVIKNVTSNEHYELAKESGIKLTDLNQDMSTREEPFMPQLAERIPLIGRGVRASGRAYTAFLDKLRMDLFADYVDKAKAVGRDAYKDRDLANQIAKLVNVGTGRGGLGMFERAAIPLNAMFFSPRLMASRLTILNPIYYIKSDPFVRKEALKTLFATSSIIATTLALGKLAGADVGLDTRNSNALKIKIGNTRLDVMGGFQQYIKVISQLASGKLISSTSGKVTTLGEGYRALNRKEILLSFVESKTAPVLSLIKTIMEQRDISGKKIDIPTEIGKRFVPMVIQDIVELYEENPKMVPLGLLGVFGVGVQTYGGTKAKGSERKFFTPKQ